VWCNVKALDCVLCVGYRVLPNRPAYCYFATILVYPTWWPSQTTIRACFECLYDASVGRSVVAFMHFCYEILNWVSLCARLSRSRIASTHSLCSGFINTERRQVTVSESLGFSKPAPPQNRLGSSAIAKCKSCFAAAAKIFRDR